MYRVIKIPVCVFCEHDLEVFERDENGIAYSWICPHCGEVEYDPFED